MVLWKTTVVLVAGGLTGSGIVAFTRTGDAPEQVAYTQEVAPSAQPMDDSFQQGYVHARFAAQRPFAGLSRVTR